MIDSRIPPGYAPGPESLNRDLELHTPPLRVLFSKWMGVFEIQEWLAGARRWSYVRLWASIDERGRPRGFIHLPTGPTPIVKAVHGFGVDELDCARTRDVGLLGPTLPAGHAANQAMRDAKKKAHQDWVRAQWSDMRKAVDIKDFEDRGFGKKVTIGMGKGSTPRSTRFVQSMAEEQRNAIVEVRKKVGTLS